MVYNFTPTISLHCARSLLLHHDEVIQQSLMRYRLDLVLPCCHDLNENSFLLIISVRTVRLSCHPFAGLKMP